MADSIPCLMGAHSTHPIGRLGRWNGAQWLPVEPGSIVARNVHVVTHGWARGLGPQVKKAGGFVLVWDERAETSEGARFDRWFGPLADAIRSQDPGCDVLAFSWCDESATAQGAANGIKSQLRTTVNGQRMAVALQAALGSNDQQVHLIGFSHGAKVVAVAATLMPAVPRHVTLLDSPENSLPIIGGALNDLTAYLNVLAPGNLDSVTFVDNYPSHFGIRYGTEPGLGGVVDTALDPEKFPLETPTPHTYSYSWYLESAEQPAKRVGFAWSPLLADPAPVHYTQLRQRTPEEGAVPEPFALELSPAIRLGGIGTKAMERIRKQVDTPRLLTEPGKTRAYGFFWRRGGDIMAATRVRWHSGPDDALVKVFANRTERARTRKGWTTTAEQHVTVPLASARPGPMLLTIELESRGPAEVEIGRATAVQGMMLPGGAEARAWVRPVAGSVAVTFFFAAVALLTRRLRR